MRGAVFGFLLMFSLSGGETNYNFIVLGDLHYAEQQFYPVRHSDKQKLIDQYIQMWKINSPDLLSAARRRAAAEASAFVIQLGDLINGVCENRTIQERMLRTGFFRLKAFFPKIPLYVIAGNHDIQLRRENSTAPVDKILFPLVSKELGGNPVKHGNYVFRKGPDLFIAVNSSDPAADCLGFIRKSLEDHPDTRYVFLLTHHPVIPASVNGPLNLLPEYDKIAELLEKRKTFIMAAHTHVFSSISRVSKKGKLSQMVFVSLGKSWYGNSVFSRFFGNDLKVRSNWDEYIRKVLKRIARKRKNSRWHLAVDDITWMGKYEASFFDEKSGFAVLRVNDRRVTVEIYIDDSGIPAQTLTALENK